MQGAAKCVTNHPRYQDDTTVWALEFIAQCENCLTKYWTINKNATKKKKLIKNTLFKGGSGGKRLRLVSGSDKR